MESPSTLENPKPRRPTLVMMVDLHGGCRERLQLVSGAHTAFCETVLLHDSFGATVDVPGFGVDAGNPDVCAVLDTSRRWFAGTNLAFTKLQGLDGKPHHLCVRGALEAAKAGLANSGWSVRVGLEMEFLTSPDIATDIESHRARTFYGDLLDGSATQRFVTDSASAAKRLGVHVESIYREFESEQLEFTTPPLDPLEAADNFLLLRKLLRRSAKRAGLRIDGSAQPHTAGLGNGLHINLSLQGAADRRFWTEDEAQRCAGHLSRTLGSIGMVLVPYPNGYLRLRNDELGSYGVGWSREKRDTLIRIAGTEGSLRLEVRLADPTCNPYLAISALLVLLEAGIGQGSEALSVRDAIGIPKSLKDAVRVFDGEQAIGIRGGLGDRLSQTLLAIKRSEVHRHSYA